MVNFINYLIRMVCYEWEISIKCAEPEGQHYLQQEKLVMGEAFLLCALYF